MGLEVDPKNVIKNGNAKLHGVTKGITYKDESNSLNIESFDAPLVAPSERSLLNFNNKKPDIDKGMHFCLYNNVWGTNLVMWFDDNMRYRFKVKIQ